MQKTYTIGELAKQGGISVRTLHHYERKGVLIPQERTSKGYRLYTQSDIQTLHLIRSLQKMGLSLDEIKTFIEKQTVSLPHVIEVQAQRLQAQIQDQQQLLAQLQWIASAYATQQEIPADAFIKAINYMNMTQQYFTSEDMEKIKQQGEKLGPDRIKEVEATWPKLIAQVKQHMERGTDPKDPAVQALAKQWMSLVSEFTGGDPQIAAGLKKMYEEKGQELKQQHGEGVPDQKMMEYIQKALL